MELKRKDHEKAKSLPYTSSSNSSSFCVKSGNTAEMSDCQSFSSGCKMIVDEIKMIGIVDTGTDISLMPQRHVDKFRNKIEPCYTTSRELLPGHHISEQSLVTNFEMSRVQTQRTFIFVPDSFLERNNLYENPHIVTLTNRVGTKLIRNRLSRVSTAQQLQIHIKLPMILLSTETLTVCP